MFVRSSDHGERCNCGHIHKTSSPSIFSTAKNKILAIFNRQLLAYQNKVLAHKNKLLFAAAEKEDLELVIEYIQQGADPIANNNLALRCAAINNHLDIVKFLIAIDRVSNTTIEHDEIPHTIKTAIANGHVQAARYLSFLPNKQIKQAFLDAYGNKVDYTAGKSLWHIGLCGDAAAHVTSFLYQYTYNCDTHKYVGDNGGKVMAAYRATANTEVDTYRKALQLA